MLVLISEGDVERAVVAPTLFLAGSFLYLFLNLRLYHRGPVVFGTPCTERDAVSSFSTGLVVQI